MAEDIASIDIVVLIIFGFFATKRASAVPAPIAIETIRPALMMKNTGKTILLFQVIYIILYYIILYYIILYYIILCFLRLFLLFLGIF